MLDNEPQNGPAEAIGNEGSTAEESTTRRTTRRRTKAAAPEPTETKSEETATRPTRTRVRRAEKAPADTDGPTDAPADADARPASRRSKRTVQSGQMALDFNAPPTDATVTAEPEIDTTSAPKRTRRRTSAADPFAFDAAAAPSGTEPARDDKTGATGRSRPATAAAALFVAPSPEEAPVRQTGQRRAASDRPAAADRASAARDEGGEATRSTRSRRRGRRTTEEAAEQAAEAAETADEAAEDVEDDEFPGESAATRRRRRRGRRGRGRGKGPHDELAAVIEDVDSEDAAADDSEEEAEAGDGVTRRRRKRRRSGAGGEESPSEEGVVTVVKIREPRTAHDEVQGVTGSTRLEAKRQRRRDGRDQRRTRPAILSESEFLARREAVDRMMAIRQRGDRTQIAVLEDGVLVEHYVTRASAGSMVGNVYLGKGQNVLPSMEAAFVDIGRGRNAVLYAGEVNWDATGLEGRARSIEQALKAGESVLVQVTKDPIGHKGARLTSHIALSGRHLVYVPNGHASGISRKLSDVERRRLRDVLKNLVPDGAGVIVRTAAEGAAEDDLARDVKRLQAQWDDIQGKAAQGGAPVLLSAEPDLVIRVVRDLFNEDFREVVIQGTDAHDQVDSYLSQVSPDLVSRVRRHTGSTDAFAEWRVDEQILKGLDRKVFLPSGGSLVIDRTEAMTVIDVNTGKYTGTGGNLEETVTRNNLEAAEEIVRQLRLRDLGGIVVIDFIDMVLESNRELVLRRLTECLGRDRTKHQVTEITSLGLVQMTRKRIGQGLLEAFSETCEHCKGRGVIMHLEPVVERKPEPVREPIRVEAAVEEPVETVSGGRRRGRRGRGGSKAEVVDAPDLAVAE